LLHHRQWESELPSEHGGKKGYNSIAYSRGMASFTAYGCVGRKKKKKKKKKKPGKKEGAEWGTLTPYTLLKKKINARVSTYKTKGLAHQSSLIRKKGQSHKKKTREPINRSPRGGALEKENINTSKNINYPSGHKNKKVVIVHLEKKRSSPVGGRKTIRGDEEGRQTRGKLRRKRIAVFVPCKVPALKRPG